MKVRQKLCLSCAGRNDLLTDKCIGEGLFSLLSLENKVSSARTSGRTQRSQSSGSEEDTSPVNTKVLSSNDCTCAGMKVWLLSSHKHCGLCALPLSLPMTHGGVLWECTRRLPGRRRAYRTWLGKLGPTGVPLWLFFRPYLQAHNMDFRLIWFRGSLQAILHSVNPTSAHHSHLPVSARSGDVLGATQNSRKTTPLNITLA